MPKSKNSLSDSLYDIRRIAEHREILSDKKIEAMTKTLKKELNSFLAEQYLEYADADGRMYVANLEKARKKAFFMNEIVKAVDNMEEGLEKEISTLIDDVYATGYKGMVGAVKMASTPAQLSAIGKELKVEPNVLKQAVNNNISKLTSLHALEKNRAEIIYQIQQQLNIGLINGDRYEDMAKRIAEKTKISETRAKNIVRTETHRNVESGLMDGAEKVSEGFDEADLIYAVTWRTRKDEKVRPQIRRKTKKGWKTSISTNGANHVLMEGQTIKVGEMFTTSDGVQGKAPGSMNEARHDCNCRCFLEYNIMTVEEFAKATKQSVDAVRKKYNMYKDADEIPEADIKILKGVGAAPFRDDVLLPDGSKGKLKEGTKITKVVTFAGKGTNKPVKVAHHLSEEYKVPESEWKKVRGDGYVEYPDGSTKHAELHWFESKETGRVKMKIKKVFEE